MNDLFLNYELSLELKNLGFDEKCMASYYTYDVENFKKDKFDYRGKFNFEFSNNLDDYIINTDKTYYIACPLKYQVFKWFREVHNMYGEIYILCGEWRIQIACLNKEDLGSYYTGYKDVEYNTFEEAELEVIKQMVNIVKDGKNI